jgi:DNA-binding transcriptional ArsR family regulator
MVAARKAAKKCCTDIRNLPDEMEAALASAGGMDGLKGRVPAREELAKEAALFQALSDPIRLQIMHSLMIVDLCPCLLKEITGLTDSKLSYHLGILESNDLIASSSRQRWRIYALTELGRSQLKS